MFSTEPQTLELEYPVIKNRRNKHGIYTVNTSITITSPYGDVSKRATSADLEIMPLKEKRENCPKFSKKSR